MQNMKRVKNGERERMIGIRVTQLEDVMKCLAFFLHVPVLVHCHDEEQRNVEPTLKCTVMLANRSSSLPMLWLR